MAELNRSMGNFETPVSEGRNGSTRLGRGHHPHACTLWLAGGGIKPGLAIGAPDDLGYHIPEDPIHLHDLQATLLHCLGLRHKKLNRRPQGGDIRLTDVAGNVVHKLLAKVRVLPEE